MSETPKPVPSRPVSPLAALLFSALILPGLGQMVTGRLAKGALMSAVPLLWLPVAAIKVGRDLYKVLPQLSQKAAEGLPVTFADIQAALSPMAGGLIWLIAPLAAVWLWSLIDSIFFLKEQKAKG